MGKLQNYLKSRIVADTISKEYSSRLQYRVVNVAEFMLKYRAATVLGLKHKATYQNVKTS